MAPSNQFWNASVPTNLAWDADAAVMRRIEMTQILSLANPHALQMKRAACRMRCSCDVLAK